mmetsp:Transcript_44429/g.140202  ORF Transcript_44429/g.140202 Transcript_44429/m.140202 type:complete len:103 (+) Transcript_44429:279-587(+)
MFRLEEQLSFVMQILVENQSRSGLTSLTTPSLLRISDLNLEEGARELLEMTRPGLEEAEEEEEEEEEEERKWLSVHHGETFSKTTMKHLILQLLSRNSSLLA